MNRLLKIALGVVTLAVMATPAFAQNSATQTTTGTTRIIQPITLTKNTDLAFGSVVKPNANTNTVAIDASTGTRAVSGAGDAALAPSASGRATYTVSGEGGQTFSISTPTTFDMQKQGGSDTITVTLTQSAATARSAARWATAARRPSASAARSASRPPRPAATTPAPSTSPSPTTRARRRPA